MKKLIEQLQAGPSVLFLGQTYLKSEIREDIFLKHIMKKLGNDYSSQSNYTDFLKVPKKEDVPNFHEWMSTKSSYIPVPETTETIAIYHWNSVFTSSFDSILDRVFRNNQRDIQQVYNHTFYPPNPRSRKRLSIHYLFGGLSAPNEGDKPPLSESNLWARKSIATLLSNRIPEILTQLGTLFIDGYDVQTDWFTPDILYPIISQLNEGQSHLFSASNYSQDNDQINQLVREGKLILHDIGLAEFFNIATESGFLQLDQSFEDIEFSRLIRIMGAKYEIPSLLWQHISNTSQILVEKYFLPYPQISKDQKYNKFKEFLFESSVASCWEGIAQGFSFKRDYEDLLTNKILDTIKSSELRKTPILLRGQTGTGKTITLKNISFKIQKNGKYPVVFIDRATYRIKKDVIDKFCEWVENQNPKAVTLIIWDGMQTPDDYYDFQNYLRSRGRKFLIVGSCYNLDGFISDFSVEAPPSLNEEEIERIKLFLNTFDDYLGEYISNKYDFKNKTFMDFLYRLLPQTRRTIRTGVENELYFSEELLNERIQISQLKNEVKTLMGELLVEAGFTESCQQPMDGERQIGNEVISEIQEFIGLVMVPGQFNLFSPIELIMRCLSRDFTFDFIEILRTLDVFRWTEDSAGNILIAPRSSLEAQLCVSQRIPGANFESEYIVKLITSLVSNSLSQKNELRFVVELLREVGPNGTKSSYYQNHFKLFAESLTKVRNENGISNSRLMLQECFFYREFSKSLSDDTDKSIKLDVLNSALEACNKAIDVVEKKPYNKDFRSRLLVEKASVYGNMAKLNDDKNEKLKYVLLSHDHSYEAYTLYPQNAHFVDVIAWTSDDIFSFEEINEYDSARIKASVLHAFDLADAENYKGESLSKLNNKKMIMFSRFGDAKLSDEAFNDLLEQRSSAGVCTKVFEKIPFLYQVEPFSRDQVLSIQKAYEYLENYKEVVDLDFRSLFLKLKLFWMSKTQSKIFSKERELLPFSVSDWSSVNDMLQRLLEFEISGSNLKLKYMIGVTYFHLNLYGKGMQVFRELEQESQYYTHRIIKHHIWCTPAGDPIQFNGVVSRISQSGRGEIQLSDIPIQIPFISYDTNNPSDITQGYAFNNFKIAFSFRGPFADFK